MDKKLLFEEMKMAMQNIQSIKEEVDEDLFYKQLVSVYYERIKGRNTNGKNN